MARLTPAAKKRLEIKIPSATEDDPAFQTEPPASSTARPPKEDAGETAMVNGISGQRLLSFIERIERVRVDIKAMQADVKEIKAEAKGTGFDVKVINYLIKLREQDKDDREEFDTLVDIYSRAIGMGADDG